MYMICIHKACIANLRPCSCHDSQKLLFMLWSSYIHYSRIIKALKNSFINYKITPETCMHTHDDIEMIGFCFLKQVIFDSHCQFVYFYLSVKTSPPSIYNVISYIASHVYVIG